MAEDEKVTKLPPVNVLKSLISQSTNIKSKINDLTGDLSGKIASAVEKHNLHAAAFKQVRKLAGMDQAKLHSYLTHFDDYRAKLELDKLAGDALDLDGDEQDEDDGKKMDAKSPQYDADGKPILPKPMFDEGKAPDAGKGGLKVVN